LLKKEIYKKIKMVLIGLVGKSKAGKDTFADYIGWQKYSFASPLKQIC